MHKFRREEVYIEALRLHKVSHTRRMQGKRPWYKKDVFDDSHLPKDLWDMDYRRDIHEKLLRFVHPKNLARDGSGTFHTVLNFRDALALVLAPEILNSHYFAADYANLSLHTQVDLGRYKLMSYVFIIEIIE